MPGKMLDLMLRLKIGQHFHSSLLLWQKSPGGFLIIIPKGFDLSLLYGLFAANDIVEL